MPGLVSERLQLVGGGQLVAHLPQNGSLRRTNAIRRSSSERYSYLSSKKLALMDISDISDIAMFGSPPQDDHLAQNSTEATKKATHRRTPARYYASALSCEEHVALAKGDINHNLKLWTEKEVALLEGSRKDLLPTNTYFGPKDQVCIIPRFVVTEAEDCATHERLVREWLQNELDDASFECTLSLPSKWAELVDQFKLRAYSRVASGA